LGFPLGKDCIFGESSFIRVPHAPNYFGEENRVRMETNLYLISTPDGILVWIGRHLDTFDANYMQMALKGVRTLVV
jgi:hypothetical protein